jgi:hypothetical protein
VQKVVRDSTEMADMRMLPSATRGAPAARVTEAGEFPLGYRTRLTIYNSGDEDGIIHRGWEREYLLIGYSLLGLGFRQLADCIGFWERR